jgi:hypothetical protein
MADELGPAVAALQRKLEEQLQDVASTKRTINMLMKMSGKEAVYTEDSAEHSGAVRADQFYGKGLATSAAEYLAMRRQACQPDEIYNALVAGGFDFDMLDWQKEDQMRIRSLAMSLAKNTGSAGKFHRLKNGTFGLRVWYDPDFLKKAATGTDSELKSAKKKKASKAAKAKAAERKPVAAKKPKVTSIAEQSKSKPKAAERKAEKVSAKVKTSPVASSAAPQEAAS